MSQTSLSITGPVTYNEADNTVTAVVSTGAELRRWDPWMAEPYFELLEMSGCDLSRLNSGSAAVLDSHRKESIGSQIGVVTRAWMERGKLMAELKLSDRPELASFRSDVASGVIRNISVGAEPLDVQETPATAGQPRRVVVKRWQPFEVSFVTVPADAGAVTRSFGIGESSMNQNANTGGAASSANANGGSGDAANTHDLIRQIVRQAHLPDGLAADLINRGAGPEEARQVAFERLVAQSEESPTQRIGHTGGTITRDYRDGMVDAMAEAQVARINPSRQVNERAREFMRPLPEIARICLSQELNTAGMSDAKVVARALTTSDFPNVLANTLGKQLQAVYLAAPAAIKRACKETTIPDFRMKHAIRLSEWPTFELVPEGGEYHYGARSDSKESYSLGTYGKILGITRQALINDDLGAFASISYPVGLAAATTEANIIVDLLTANAGNGPVMSDTAPLFDAAHQNKALPGGITETTLSAARLALRSMKGLDGTTPIDATPKYLLVPAALETAAEIYLSVIYPAQAANANPFTGKLELLVDPRLDAKSVDRWYVFADPAVLPVLEYAYLEGQVGLYTEVRQGFNVDGVEVKARIDFGAGVVDWRGAHMNPGK